MIVRLGFAVAAHLEPEILVVDEVLAVGDAEFQKKAIGKMQDISKGEGRTVLFVSHNMDAVRRLCRKGMLLKNGAIDFCGEAGATVDYYVSENRNNRLKPFQKQVSEEIFIESAFIFGEKNEPACEILLNEKWEIRLRLSILKKTKNTVFAVGITTVTDIPINTTWSEPLNLDAGDYELSFCASDILFQKGIYKVILGISRGPESIYYEDDFLQFEVMLTSKNVNGNLVKVDGTTGIILNQLDISLSRK